MLETAVAAALILLLAALILILGNSRRRNRERERGNADAPGSSDCPLCGEALPRGVRVHSVLFPGKEFDLMRIYGCPHCWASHPAPAAPQHLRRCPYCKGTVPRGGYVMAQVYNRPHRRTHVHVYGCSLCKPGKG